MGFRPRAIWSMLDQFSKRLVYPGIFPFREAANALHLRPSIVSAIEDNNYSEVPGHIFLKGYVRSYARYVGLPEEQVLTQLDHVLLDQELSRKPEAPRKGVRQPEALFSLGWLWWG